jgi:toxin-antitoxin system PIN domain toxin
MTTTATNLSLVDTNVLVYALYVAARHHGPAKALLDRAAAPEAAFCVAPQNLIEFYAVVTNPRRVTEPKSSEVALGAITELLALPGLSLLPVPGDLLSRWMGLAQEQPLTGRRVFDLQLIATMLGNGVRRIYTFNAKDFEPFQELEVIVPTLAPEPVTSDPQPGT